MLLLPTRQQFDAWRLIRIRAVITYGLPGVVSRLTRPPSHLPPHLRLTRLWRLVARAQGGLTLRPEGEEN